MFKCRSRWANWCVDWQILMSSCGHSYTRCSFFCKSNSNIWCVLYDHHYLFSLWPHNVFICMITDNGTSGGTESGCQLSNILKYVISWSVHLIIIIIIIYKIWKYFMTFVFTYIFVWYECTKLSLCVLYLIFIMIIE